MNILIIKIGAIGDVVVATTMLPAIQRMHPGARITWVVGRRAAPVLHALDFDLEIFEVDDQAILTGSLWARGKELLRVAWHFRFRRFFLVLVPYLSRKYLALCFAVRGRKRAFWQKRADIRGRYRGVNYIRLLSERDGNSSDYSTGGEEEYSGDTPRFPRLKAGRFLNGNVPGILLVPGGAKNLLADDYVRRWPLAHYAALTKMFLESGYTVGITGGQGDLWVREGFAGLAVTDYIGKLSLEELLYLLREVKLMVAHDTGPMHLVGLAGGKLVALFGPTLPAEVAPLHNTLTLTAPGFIPCRPCYDGKTFASGCSSPLCMERLLPQAVFDAAEQLLLSR